MSSSHVNTVEISRSSYVVGLQRFHSTKARFPRRQRGRASESAGQMVWMKEVLSLLEGGIQGDLNHMECALISHSNKITRFFRLKLRFSLVQWNYNYKLHKDTRWFTILRGNRVVECGEVIQFETRVYCVILINIWGSLISHSTEE